MEEMCTNLSALLCDGGMGGYKIFYEEELIDCLPDGMRNRETLEAALKNLNGGGYIDVKYARGNTFCIECLKKYESPKQTEFAETVRSVGESTRQTLTKKAYIFLSLFAFLGGAAGGCAAAILWAVL